MRPRPSYKELVPPVLVIANVIFTFYLLDSDKFSQDFWPVTAVSAVHLVIYITFIFSATHRHRKQEGIRTFLPIFSAAAWLSLTMSYSLDLGTNVTRIIFVFWSIVFSSLILSFLYEFPSVVIPALRQNPSVSVDDLDTADRQLLGFRDLFRKFQKSFDQERTLLGQALASINDEVKGQQNALMELIEERERVQQELEYIKKISSLTKEQQKLFLDLLQRNKRQDYFIGLVLGILSSAIVAIVVWFLQSMRG